MKGNNTLTLCGAEMAVAVQEYLDKRMTVYAPEVTNVGTDTAGGCKVFVIVLKAKLPEELA